MYVEIFLLQKFSLINYDLFNFILLLSFHFNLSFQYINFSLKISNLLFHMMLFTFQMTHGSMKIFSPSFHTIGHISLLIHIINHCILFISGLSQLLMCHLKLIGKLIYMTFKSVYLINVVTFSLFLIPDTMLIAIKILLLSLDLKIGFFTILRY